MKLARIEAGRGPEAALAVEAGFIPIARHLAAAPASTTTLIAEWTHWRERLSQLAEREPNVLPFTEVRLLAPVERPGKIMGIGLNYADHAAESGLERPQDQLWFAKAATAANGPFDNIRLPRVSEQLDYEAELVVVIGRTCRYADDETARDAIFGYTVGNDVSVRDWQLRTSQFVIGKSFDSSAPFGPWIVTPDTFDPARADISCLVNGEQRQRSNTRNLIFDPIAMVRHLSQAMTLEPGDLLFSGTPSGVGAAMVPPRWLRAGDVVEIEIKGIGRIANTVVAD